MVEVRHLFHGSSAVAVGVVSSFEVPARCEPTAAPSLLSGGPEVTKDLVEAVVQAGISIDASSLEGIWFTQGNFICELYALQLLGNGYVTHRSWRKADAVIRRSDLDWALVYPANLTNGPPTGIYQAEERPNSGAMRKISRADVAGFVLREVTTAGEWSRRTVVLAS